MNTLHCIAEVAVSAAQFNRSVSAMPPIAPTSRTLARQGTADTLSKG